MTQFDPNLANYWLAFAIILMVLETILPGLVAVFLGLAALIVAALIWMEVLSNWPIIFTSWFALSVFFLLTLRNVFARMAPGERAVQDIDEEKDYIGLRVEIVTKVTTYDHSGRVKIQGTTWGAICPHTTLLPGQFGYIIGRDGQSWILDPEKGEKNVEPK